VASRRDADVKMKTHDGKQNEIRIEICALQAGYEVGARESVESAARAQSYLAAFSFG
jgi:hypothetical protein